MAISVRSAGFPGVLFQSNCLPRWISLLIVIIGVALVGLSGSMIKDTIKEVTTVIRTMTAPEPTEVPQATTVLVGEKYWFLQQINGDLKIFNRNLVCSVRADLVCSTACSLFCNTR